MKMSVSPNGRILVEKKSRINIENNHTGTATINFTMEKIFNKNNSTGERQKTRESI